MLILAKWLAGSCRSWPVPRTSTTDITTSSVESFLMPTGASWSYFCSNPIAALDTRTAHTHYNTQAEVACTTCTNITNGAAASELISASGMMLLHMHLHDACRSLTKVQHILVATVPAAGSMTDARRTIALQKQQGCPLAASTISVAGVFALWHPQE